MNWELSTVSVNFYGLRTGVLQISTLHPFASSFIHVVSRFSRQNYLQTCWVSSVSRYIQVVPLVSNSYGSNYFEFNSKGKSSLDGGHFCVFTFCNFSIRSVIPSHLRSWNTSLHPNKDRSPNIGDPFNELERFIWNQRSRHFGPTIIVEGVSTIK